MFAYIVRRLILMLPTLVGILLVSFVIIQFAPGGPVERIIAELQGADIDATAGFTGGEVEVELEDAGYRAGLGADPELIKELEAQFGFDRPAPVRFLKLLGDYLTFDFGTSYFRDVPVLDLIADKLPVSVSLGFWTVLLSYLVSIPLGIAKAVREGTPFDIWSSALIVFLYAIPSFLLGVLLILLFAGGEFLAIFPLRGIVSDNWSGLSWPARIADYLWHLALPITALVAGAFATTTLLMKNAFLEEIRKNYVMTARAKGLSEREVMYGHVLRNAILVILAGLPAKFMAVFFTGALLIETIFSLDGLGLLSYESLIDRDYAVVFASLYIFSLVGLVVHLVSDVLYTIVDPRIDFEAGG